MNVFPNTADWHLAERVYRRFREKPGSAHIASWGALACLATVVRKYRPKAVLEFGCGIGTITYLLLSASSEIRILGIEANDFCLDQLERNIPPELRSRLDVAQLGDRTKGQFDLVIIDAPYEDNDAFFRPGTICFVEGNRERQTAKLEDIAESKSLAIDLDRQLRWLFQIRRRKFHLGRKTISLPVLMPVRSCKIGILRQAESRVRSAKPNRTVSE